MMAILTKLRSMSESISKFEEERLLIHRCRSATRLFFSLWPESSKGSGFCSALMLAVGRDYGGTWDGADVGSIRTSDLKLLSAQSFICSSSLD